jgi:heptosyltransferase-1
MKNVLIIRQSAIGDIVFASPFAAALKRTFPECRVSWLVEEGLSPLLEASPHIDECISIPSGDWRRQWRDGKKLSVLKQMRAFGKTLKARHFDVAIDLQGLLKSGVMTRMTCAPRRIGLGAREGAQLLMTENFPKDRDDARISSEYFSMAKLLGLDVGAFVPELFVKADTEQRIFGLLAAHKLQPRRYAVFAPFTTRPQKHWTAEGWRQLASDFREKTGLTPLLLGGGNDIESAKTLVNGAKNIVNLVGKTTLAESVALIKNAGALVGVDTGLTHMGIAFHVPTVALFGSTRPYLDTCRDNARVIWLGFKCSPCRRRPTCGGAYGCMQDIGADLVRQELHACLNPTSEPKKA